MAGLIFLIIGSILATAGAVWLLVNAFRVDWRWGLAVFLLGWTVVPWIIFIIKFWSDARRPFTVMMIGYAVVLLATFIPVLVFDAPIIPDRLAADDGDAASDGSPEASESILPPPRPTARPVHPSWEAIVEELSSDQPQPTPITEEVVVELPAMPGRSARPALSWEELGSKLGRELEISLVNGSEITASLLAVEPSRIQVKHDLGGGGAVYWIERKQVVAMRLVK
jgi:hypothetical protein